MATCTLRRWSTDRVSATFGEASSLWQGWIYTPAVTVWVFLSQCLSADHSCREAVARLAAGRISQGHSEKQRCQEPNRDLVPDTFYLAMDIAPSHTQETCTQVAEKSAPQVAIRAITPVLGRHNCAR